MSSFAARRIPPSRPTASNARSAAIDGRNLRSITGRILCDLIVERRTSMTPVAASRNPPSTAACATHTFPRQRSSQNSPDRKSTRLKLQSLMRISYAVFCLKQNNLEHITHAISSNQHDTYTIKQHPKQSDYTE